MPQPGADSARAMHHLCVKWRLLPRAAAAPSTRQPARLPLVCVCAHVCVCFPPSTVLGPAPIHPESERGQGGLAPPPAPSPWVSPSVLSRRTEGLGPLDDWGPPSGHNPQKHPAGGSRRARVLRLPSPRLGHAVCKLIPTNGLIS